MKKSYRKQLIDAIENSAGYHGKGYPANAPFTALRSDVALHRWIEDQIKKRCILELKTRQGSVTVCARQFVEALQVANDDFGIEINEEGLHLRDTDCRWNFIPVKRPANVVVSIPL